MIRDNLPSFISSMSAMSDLINAEQPETDALFTGIREMLEEFFVDTFTIKTAAMWEDMVGLPTSDMPMDARRKRVAARLLSTSPVTPRTLGDMAERITGREVSVAEYFDEFRASLDFAHTLGSPPYLGALRAEIELIRPYHIVIDYGFTRGYLGMYGSFTLYDLEPRTLEDLLNCAPVKKRDRPRARVMLGLYGGALLEGIKAYTLEELCRGVKLKEDYGGAWWAFLWLYELWTLGSLKGHTLLDMALRAPLLEEEQKEIA